MTVNSAKSKGNKMYPRLKDSIILQKNPIGGLVYLYHGNMLAGKITKEKLLEHVKLVELGKETSPLERWTTKINRTARDILELCNGERSHEEICKILAEKFDEDISSVKKKVSVFLQKCEVKGILKVENASVPTRASVVGMENFDSPLQVAIMEITYKCNLKCRHCYVYDKSDVNSAGEMSTEQIIKVLKKLHTVGVMDIQFTGGEPFLRPDFFEILDFCKEKFCLMISTNGTLINKEVAKKLTEYRPLLVQISLDGGKDIHEQIRGVPGCYEQTIRGIKALSVYFPEIVTTVAMTVTRENINEVEKVVPLVKSLGARIMRVGLTVWQGRAKTNRKELEPSKEEIRNFKKRVFKLIRKYNDKGRFMIQMGGIIDKIQDRVGMGCDLMGRIVLSPEGNVRCCVPMKQRSIGNILKQDLEEICRPSVVEYFRSIPKPNRDICNNCENFPQCRNCYLQGATMSDNCAWKDHIYKNFGKILGMD